MKTPLISVIIPTYNEEKFIERCLKPIKAQTFKNFEIIVIDGKSSDRTVSICKKYTKKIFITGRGIGNQENYGSQKAKGKFLLFLQADTKIARNTLEKLHNFLEENNSIVYGNLVFYYESDGIRGAMLNEIVFLYWHINKFFKLGASSGQTLFVRKDIFQKNGGFRNIIFEDADLGLRLKKIGQNGLIFNTNIVSSVRRFKKDGYVKTLFFMLIDTIRLFLGKPKSILEYPAIR